MDDLTDVLDDATYGGDAAVVSGPAGTVGYVEPTLVWSGALAAGASVTIEYTVTITGDGDHRLENVAFAPPGGACQPADCPNRPRSASTVSTPPPGWRATG
ncbi:DUF7927 domain-containing protein [Nocardioides sambongensis]|uniref:DUF7927 domain-containing protein n=1 Tax=Nocardioides sambongensis TaxID=2589074 RepID=UPI00112879FD|nr:hypothetical protein [Nocardioides sambongensis]